MSRDPLNRRDFISEAGKCVALAGLPAPIAGSTAAAIKGAKQTPMAPVVLNLDKPEYLILK
jgi:hypothetical protein